MHTSTITQVRYEDATGVEVALSQALVRFHRGPLFLASVRPADLEPIHHRGVTEPDVHRQIVLRQV